MAAWKRRPIEEVGCFPLLIALNSVDFNGNYSSLGRLFGGQKFIREQLLIISETLRSQSMENIPELSRLLGMATITLGVFARKQGLSSSTASAKMIKDFVAGVEIDQQTMLHIASHFFYMLSIELLEMEMMQKRAA